MSLTGPERPAASGNARSIVVLLHGYGADGNDLLGLADPLAPHLPDTIFMAPNAPDPCSVNPMGRQWFPIPYIDGSSEAAASAGLLASARLLDAWIDEALERTGLTADRLVLMGFSQGTMISLHVAPRRPVPVAGIVGFSGRLLAPERLAAEVRSKPPVLLVHGDADDVVPPASMPAAAEALTDAGFTVRTHLESGLPHSIGPQGLGLGLGFIKQVLGDA